VSCRQDDVLELGLKLLQGSGYRGLASVEFKRDPRDDVFKLIEVYVRSGTQIALALAAGVDLPYIAYRDAVGEHPIAVDTYRLGLTWVDSIPDLAASMAGPTAERAGWLAWARSAMRANSHAYFAFDDPGPSVLHAWGTARTAMSLLPRLLGRSARGPGPAPTKTARPPDRR
jgi:predicted ATP-grasp superfamily ATP-dependent carboligase